MDLNAVRLFVQAVQTGSLSAAAERGRVPLATLSRRIRELERSLRVQLLDRSTRGVRLTEAGARLYEHALQGLETLAAAEDAVLGDQAGLRGRLRLSLPPGFEPWWALLRRFQARHPGIALSVLATERRIDLVEDAIDVALRVGALAEEAAVARRIGGYRHLLVAAPALLARVGAPAAVVALAALPCAVWSADPMARPLWRFGSGSVAPQAVLMANDYRQLREAALAGLAVTELPPFLAAPYLESGALVRLLPKEELPEQALHLVYLAQRYPSTLVRAYLAFCREEAAACLG